MKNRKSILMIALLILLTVLISAGPVAYNIYTDSVRLRESVRITYQPYSKSAMSAEEFAILYSKGVIANNSSLLNAVNEEIPKDESVRDELGAVLETVFESDSDLKKKFLEAIKAPMENYEEDKILFVNESYATTFRMVTAFFIDADAMLEICYEKSTGVVVTADYREFGNENLEIIDSCDKALSQYYCETLQLNTDRYYFAPLIFEIDTYIQFGIRQGTMSDKEIQYYN